MTLKSRLGVIHRAEICNQRFYTLDIPLLKSMRAVALPIIKRTLVVTFFRELLQISHFPALKTRLESLLASDPWWLLVGMKRRCDVCSGGSGDNNDEQVPQGAADARRRRATRRDGGTQHQYPYRAARSQRSQRSLNVRHTRDDQDHPLVVDVRLKPWSQRPTGLNSTQLNWLSWVRSGAVIRA